MGDIKIPVPSPPKPPRPAPVPASHFAALAVEVGTQLGIDVNAETVENVIALMLARSRSVEQIARFIAKTVQGGQAFAQQLTDRARAEFGTAVSAPALA